MTMITKTESAGWIWVHTGEQRAINLRHVTGHRVRADAHPDAYLSLTSARTEGDGRPSARGVAVDRSECVCQAKRIAYTSEAEALHAYLTRRGRPLDDPMAE